MAWPQYAPGLIAAAKVLVVGAVAARALGIIDTRTMRQMLGIAASAWIGGTGFFGAGVTAGNVSLAPLNAIMAGATGGMIAGGPEGAFAGAFTAGMFYGVGDLGVNHLNGTGSEKYFGEGTAGKVLAHGVAGCVSASATGGTCGQGALSAGFAEGVGGKLKGLSVEQMFVAKMTIGGTASVLGCGKFANGAVTGAYGYIFNCVAHECWTQGVLGATKAVAGGLTVATGAAICTGLAGCVVGAPMMAFGASDALQGGGMVIDAVQGISSEGFNLIKTGFQTASPKWGGAAYAGTSLGLNAAAMVAKVPLVVGASDGVNRVKSIFDITVSRWDNSRAFLGNVLSQSVNRLILTGSAIGKSITFGRELNAAGNGQ